MGDNVKVERVAWLSLFNALKYSWTLITNGKLFRGHVIYFLFAFIKKCMANKYAAGQKKDANHVQKESSLIGSDGEEGVLSLCHMPSSVKTQPQWIRRKQRPKMQYACEKWTYKRYKYSKHTQILHTHTHSIYPCMCATKNQKNFKHWIFLFFLHFTFVLFCFWLRACALRGAQQYEIEIAFGIHVCWQAAHKNYIYHQMWTSNHFRFFGYFHLDRSGKRAANRISRLHFVCKFKRPESV